VNESLRALVRGRVQGVGFRAFVVWQARELSLKGFARNLSDGTTVEVGRRGSEDSARDSAVVAEGGAADVVREGGRRYLG
jgi:acylphosphatase